MPEEKMFCVKDGETFVQEKEGWSIFGDFTLKVIGELCSRAGGYLVASCASKVLGQLVERYSTFTYFSTATLMNCPYLAIGACA